MLTLEKTSCVVTVGRGWANCAVCHHPAQNFDDCGGDTGKLHQKEGSVESPTESDQPLSCSGVILDLSAGIVLCHGLIFFPFFDEELDLSEYAFLPPEKFAEDLQIHIQFPSQHVTSSATENPLKKESWAKAGATFRTELGIIPLSNSTWSSKSWQPSQAQLLMLVACPEFQEIFSKVFSKSDNWKFYTEEERQEYKALQRDSVYLNWFAVLKLQGACKYGKEQVPSIAATSLQKGHEIFTCGSPFGSFCPDIFMNTLSRGIVSNLAGEGNVLILTDARCLPGTEGGGVFIVSENHVYLVGLIVAPLCWKANEWIGLTLVCSVGHVIKNIRKVLTMAYTHSKDILWTTFPEVEKHFLTPPGGFPQLFSTVVLVECGSVWGSGVLLNSRLVLTCRHILNGASSVRVTTKPISKSSCVSRGKVVFATNELSPYDIGLVKLERSLPNVRDLVLASRFCTGEDVSVIGFGVFGKSCGPSVTAGILSAVITADKEAVMLQTTCAVNAGASGGALFTAHTQELLGVIVSNTRDTRVGATYPHLNFSVPVTVLEPLLSMYIQNGDPRVFEGLNRASDDAKSVWRLQRKPTVNQRSKL
ncbi:peroxisomal leader peptide-processing protease [Latimeria chalumnae]|uniref:Peroxisomal leader peptide-processing protease n=1 Tax=Latimeria chalumnae TaxID=7897 RepID=H3BC03_LATCH|nr:PREDICTED: peroxisomal leader peptide-processing protease [Latimeria chalumnae]|eukprot:XP_005991422.1 PREDICTED: peroxisomal leader peptide-processing protease [Latimeria chalumnae]